MKYRLRAMDLWYRALPGSMLVDAEAEALSKLLSQLFGECLLQVGGPADMSLVKASPVAHKIYLSPFLSSYAAHDQIQANLDELPVISDSMDAVLLVHMLEFVRDPKQVLREMMRVLKPNSQLIILGLNPSSLWGLSRVLGNNKGFPWQGRFWSMRKVQCWLNELGLQIVSKRTMCFRPPVLHSRQVRKYRYLEAAGRIAFPNCGAVYMLSAQKKVIAMTPQKNKWWEKKMAVNNGYVNPTTRNICDE